MNILDEIIGYKKSEVAARKKAVSITSLEHSEYFNREVLSLKKFLMDTDRTGIIAEFKRRSPSKGIINNEVDVVKLTMAYTTYGASGLSVLTDNHFFGGSVEDLQQARINIIPILRKDFTIDEYQVIEAKSIGADVILLIAACLTPAEVKRLASTAKQLKLEVLLELHDENELDHICDDVDLVGVNNRNLKTFSVDLHQSVRLAERIGSEKLKIAESGITNAQDIAFLRQSGFVGFLIGEHFMKQSDPVLFFKKFANEIKLFNE